MTKSFSKITVLALSIMILISGFAFAAQSGKKAEHFKKFAAELNLSESQIEQLKELKASKAALIEQKKAIKQAREDLKAAVNSGASEAELKAKIEKLEKLREQAMQRRMEHKEKLKSILTTEQYAKMMTMKGNMKHGKHGKGMQGQGMQGQPDYTK